MSTLLYSLLYKATALALDIMPGLISHTSGLNQVHAWLLKKLMLIPRSHNPNLKETADCITYDTHQPEAEEAGQTPLVCYV